MAIGLRSCKPEYDASGEWGWKTRLEGCNATVGAVGEDEDESSGVDRREEWLDTLPAMQATYADSRGGGVSGGSGNSETGVGGV